MKKVILALLSPFRAALYDFRNLRLPDTSDYELTLVTDQDTLANYIPQQLVGHCQVVDLVNYTESVRFLSLDAIAEIIQCHLEQGNNVILHSEEEMFLDYVAQLNEKYHLPGLTLDRMQIFRNKFVMKQELLKFAYAEWFSIPNFALVDEQNNLPGDFSFPLIAKPLNLAGTIGVKKYNELGNFQAYRAENQSAVICEEYVTGELVHCDALVMAGAAKFVLCGKYYAPMDTATINLNYIGSETITDTTYTAKLIAATKAVINFLSVPDGMVHIEFIINDSGLYFVEIGKRPAGAWISKMYQQAYGINLFNNHLESQYLTSDQFDEPKIINQYVAGIHLLLPHSGVLSGVRFPANLECNGEFMLMQPKLNQPQIKTYSMLDVVAEAIFYSDDRNKFENSLAKLITDSEIDVTHD